MSNTTTKGIRITARPSYVPERSTPSQGMYFFAYEITVANEGELPARLISRHWVITDGTGQKQEVRGPGVVGEQPRLSPGQQFRYVSYCPLETPVGSMEGAYQMVRDDGSEFEARIGAFTLAAPNALN